MQQVLALVQQVLALLNGVSAAVAALRGLLAGVPGALASLALAIADLTSQFGPLVTSLTKPGGWLGAQGDKLDQIVADLEDSPSDLPAILAAVEAIGGGGPTNQDVLDAIAALRGGTATVQQVKDAVDGLSFPSVPSASDNAEAVWSAILLTGGANWSADKLLAYAGHFGYNVGIQLAFPNQGNPDFLLYSDGVWWDGYSLVNYIIPAPTPDYANILASDTVLSWLNRTETTYGGWAVLPDTDLCWATCALSGALGHYYHVCRLHDSDLQALRGEAAAALTAPVWPGVDGATFGTPVALDTGLTIVGPMHGVAVELTSVPASAGKYQFDTQASWLHLGAVAFYDDAGNIEQAQSFSFETHLLCPRSMAVAAGCYVRAKTAVVGTVTPWAIGTVYPPV